MKKMFPCWNTSLRNQPLPHHRNSRKQCCYQACAIAFWGRDFDTVSYTNHIAPRDPSKDNTQRIKRKYNIYLLVTMFEGKPSDCFI